MTKLLVALDGMTPKEAVDTAINIKSVCCGVKLGDVVLEEGLGLVRYLKDRGCFVMVDNKWYDIPSTVHNKIRRENDAGADLITVSLNNDPESLDAARRAATKAKLVGVTVLTASSPPGGLEVLEKMFLTKALLAWRAGFDGITCPGPFLPMMVEVRRYDIGLFALTPGVRMPGDDHGDQRLVAHERPKEATYAVVGRPIVAAKDIMAAANRYKRWLSGL